MFGDDRSDDALSAAEEGQVDSVSKPKEDKELSGAEYYLKLLLCIVGLQASYLTWGVLQVLHVVMCSLRACMSGNRNWSSGLFLSTGESDDYGI